MKLRKFLNSVLAITMCLVMTFVTCAFAEPVIETVDFLYEEEVFTDNVETPVEEQGEVSLDMEMPEVFDKVEIIEPDDLPELDIDSDCYTHVFRNGVCVSCGKVCDHPEDCQYSQYSCTRYEQLDQRVHTAYYVKEVYCGECDSILKSVTEEKGWEEDHCFYELDGETGMEICGNCGFICENPDVGDDTNTCTHPNLEDYGLSEEWDEGEIISLDENGHTITKVEYYGAYCPDCGWGTWEPTGKSRIVTERHDWDWRGSICRICGVVCKHPNVVKQNTWEEYDAEYEAIDVTGHKVTRKLSLALRCIDCNKALGQKTDQTVEYTEPHFFHKKTEWNSDLLEYVVIGNICYACDYFTTDESVFEGEGDSQQCTHPNMTQELRYRDSGFEKFDVRNHKVNYEAYLVDVCPDCGEVNWENEERVPESGYTAIEPHDFWTNGDAEEYPFSYCVSCGYFVECDHANATYTETLEAFVYSNITETTHDSVGAGYDIFRCPDCGITNRSANGNKVIETEEPHKFVDGVCACGYFVDIHTVTLPETMKLGLKESAVMPMSYLPAAAENTVMFESSTRAW